MRAERVRHLGARFFTSAFARRPGSEDVDRVRAILSPAEYAVWDTLGRADRAESVAVARRVSELLPAAADPVWVAAGLLHDAGKTESGLGTLGRVLATLVAAAVGPERAGRSGGRIGRYVRHPEIGADRLRRAGCRPEVAAWAAVHHDPARWSDAGIPVGIGAALARADGEPSPDA